MGLESRSGYGQSKWVAERLVCNAIEQLECRALVFRPGVISGDRKTGASNRKDAVSILLCGLIEERVCCIDAWSPLPKFYNLCPVDFVAEAVVRVFLSFPDPQKESSSYHLCGKKSIAISTLVGFVQEAGFELKEVSAEVFCRRVRQLPETSLLFPFKSLFASPATGALGQVAAAPGAELCCGNIDRALARMSPPTVRHLPITSEEFTRALAFLVKKEERQGSVEATQKGPPL